MRKVTLFLILLAGAGAWPCSRAATIVVTNTLPSGPGSLYDALDAASFNLGTTNRITFNIPGTPPFVISPTGYIAGLYNWTTIDGTTQPGWSNNYPAIVVDGSLAGSNGVSCLYVFGSDCLIRGLRIQNYSGSAIDMSGQYESVQSNRVEGCHLLSNGYYGVELYYASNSIVGGYAVSNRNVISGNNFMGIYLEYGSGNVVAGNWIGVSPTNSAMAIAGQGLGVGLYEASDIVISGSNTAQQVISGNEGAGIWSFQSSGIVIIGNRIGCDESVMVAVSNHTQGILFLGGTSNRIGGAGTALRNFISGNKDNGIELTGNSDGSVVLGNFIGVNAAGSGPLPNLRGVLVNSEASNCVVGATGTGNVISGNRVGGVLVFGSHNRVEGNILGLAINISSVISNGGDGVYVSGSYNTIGGTNSGNGNVISGNERYGVYVNGGPSNVVQGNVIGLDVFGNRRPNQSGVYLNYTVGNVIGGTDTNARNIISGNSYAGVLFEGQASRDFIQGNYIGVSFDGVTQASNAVDGIRLWGGTNITIGGTEPGAGNVIAGNGNYNIYAVEKTVGLKIQGNYIGLGADGKTNYWTTNGLGRVGAAVYGQDTLVGGTETNARNIISGNGGYGVFVLRATNTLIQGNWIGLGASGTNVAPNGPYLSSYGVYLALDSTRTIIGGLTPGARNVIAGDYAAIYAQFSHTNFIYGNYLGLTPDGMTAVTATQYGVQFNAGNSSFIGGTNIGAGNVIYGKQVGVSMVTSNTSRNTIQGNLINLNPAGEILTTNVTIGVSIVNSRSNLIGGSVAAARNVIFDRSAGIQFYQSNAVGNVAQGNYIGVGPDGYSPRKVTPQAGTGVDTFLTRGRNTIGGTNAGEGNIIAYHAYGVIVFGSNATTAILGNTIYSNVWNAAPNIGIDLAPEGIGANGTGTNDPVPDADIGPNNLQNFPVITNAISLPGSTRVQGYLASAPNSRFRIEFFYCDTTNPEGRMYLGTTNILTVANGTGTFSAILNGYAPTSKYITATATDTNNNTSEFTPPLIRSSTAADTDGDGMPDFWETFYGLNPANAADATNSLDADGVINLAEYWSGTIPNNPNSFLEVIDLYEDSAAKFISFPSSQYRHYNLESATAVSNGAPWSTIITNIFGSGIVITLDDLADTNLFYRVRCYLP